MLKGWVILLKKQRFYRLKSLKPDIILLQETHAEHNVQSVLLANWLGQAYHANYGAKAQSLVISFSKNIHFIQKK